MNKRRIYTDKKRIMQHRNNHNKKNKKESKWNMVSINTKIINWHTCENVVKNKEASRIRINARYIAFWRKFPSIRSWQSMIRWIDVYSLRIQHKVTHCIPVSNRGSDSWVSRTWPRLATIFRTEDWQLYMTTN